MLPARMGRPAQAEIHMMDRHFTLEEIAERWGMSYEAVRERFQDEPGVLMWGRRRGGRKFPRVPQTVMERVYRQMVNGANL